MLNTIYNNIYESARLQIESDRAWQWTVWESSLLWKPCILLHWDGQNKFDL